MSSGEGRGENLVKATLAPVTDDQGAPLGDADKQAKAVTVHFNPESLDITLSNNFKKSSGDSPTQLVDEATAQLSLELQFDTTHTGVDVRQDTGKIAAFLKPLDRLVSAGRNQGRRVRVGRDRVPGLHRQLLGNARVLFIGRRAAARKCVALAHPAGTQLRAPQPRESGDGRTGSIQQLRRGVQLQQFQQLFGIGNGIHTPCSRQERRHATRPNGIMTT